MGKKIIIKGADFSENGMHYAFIDLTSNAAKSHNHVLINNAEGECKIIQLKNGTSGNIWSILVLPVSSYVGKKLYIINNIAMFTTNANYGFFTSDLGTLTFADIPNLSGSGSSSTIRFTVTSISSLNGDLSSDGLCYVEAVVPENAQYLCFSFNGTLSNEDKIKVYQIDED